ncbi:MAG: T9SS type A sorting domain-containing protein, partial [Flavobacteriales bacterium]|nr:T9SS type A sorting domain-containing protein [Flavobacteriales bacterium]
DEMYLSSNELIADDISIYPNPVQDVISFNSVIADINSLEIFDINGKSMLKSFNITRLDVSMLMSGVYFITIETSRGRVTKKIIKR